MQNVMGFTDADVQTLKALPPKERILRTASDLFSRFSVHAVGIDRIISESGVAKMTFYKHFPSKANLVATYLSHQSAGWFSMLSAATGKQGLTPSERIPAIFEALGQSFALPSFRGCPFVKGMAEFGPDADSPEIQALIAAYFEGLRELIGSLIEPLALADRQRSVTQILTLIQGSIVMAQATPDPAIAEAAGDAARLLLQAGSTDGRH